MWKGKCWVTLDWNKKYPRPEGLAQLVSEPNSILAALYGCYPPGEGFPRPSGVVILKLNTKPSFLLRVCNGKSTSWTTKPQSCRSRHRSQNARAEGNWLLARIRPHQAFSVANRSAFCLPPKVFAPLISSGTLRTPGTRRSQPGLRGRQVSPRKQWRQLCELDLLGEPEHLKHPDSVPIHIYLVPP
jgi:hypothetical protein